MNGITINQVGPHTWAVADKHGRLGTIRRDEDGLWEVIEPAGLDAVHVFQSEAVDDIRTARGRL